LTTRTRSKYVSVDMNVIHNLPDSSCLSEDMQLPSASRSICLAVLVVGLGMSVVPFAGADLWEPPADPRLLDEVESEVVSVVVEAS